jgi:hypothetical protein
MNSLSPTIGALLAEILHFVQDDDLSNVMLTGRAKHLSSVA